MRDAIAADPVFAAITAHEAVTAEYEAYADRCIACERHHGAGLTPVLAAEGRRLLALDTVVRRRCAALFPPRQQA